MNNLTETNHKNWNNEPKLNKVLHSLVTIIGLTLFFGALSYALIQINNGVFQLTISESLWCGLAMALVTAYYFFQKAKKQSKSATE